MSYLSNKELKLTLDSPKRTIKATDIEINTGGSLVCGAYQYSYRLYSSKYRRYTKWSILSFPVHIFKHASKTNASNNRNSANIGELSDLKVRLKIELSSIDITNYDYIELSVVEHLGNLGKNNPITAGLLGVKKLADLAKLSIPGTNRVQYSIEHTTNKVTRRVDINEIVIPFSELKSCKTLSIKDNRLLLGNIEYFNLDENINPTVVGGGILTETSDISNPSFATKYKGYFPDVYRFTISYYDDEYNFSSPKVLDLSGIIGNDTTNTNIPDFKFPQQARFSNNLLAQKGLKLTIKNHPTWAKGFVILRAKRIKDYLFETPLIPFIEVQGAGPTSGYPDTFSADYGNGTSDKEIVGAQPMNPVGTFVPENSLKPIYIGNTVGSNRDSLLRSGRERTLTASGEVIPSAEKPVTKFGIIVPQMYNSDAELVDAFTFTGSELLETNEVIGTNLLLERNDTARRTKGFAKSAEVASTYLGRDNLLKSITKRTSNIKGFTQLGNGSEGALLNGQPIGQYSNLLTTGTGWSKMPQNNRMGVIETENNFNSLTAVFTPYYTVYPTTPEINGLDVDPNTTVTRNNMAYFNIATIKKGLPDDRYGDVNERHEFIYTGAGVDFDLNPSHNTLSEYTVNIWGGDCYNSYHDFAYSTSSFSLPNSQKSISGVTTNLDKITEEYGGGFISVVDGTGHVMSLPVPYDKYSQSVSIPIRSEVNGNVVTHNGGTLNELDDTTTSSRPFQTGAGGFVPNRQSINKSPFFDYLISPAAVKEGDAQVFFPRPELSLENTRFSSRILYSDLKLYQTEDDSFSKFRILNTYDLDETNGEIKTLQLLADNLYSIQERAIALIPINASTIETANGVELSVRSGEVIGDPRVLTDKYGIQIQNNLLNTKDFIVFSDYRTKRIILLNPDQSLDFLSSKGIKTDIDNNLIKTASFTYDNIEGLLYANVSDVVYVFNTNLGIWETTLPSINIERLSGTYTNVDDSRFFISGGDNIIYTSMTDDSDTSRSFIGSEVSPSISFVINPDIEFGKVFDNIVLQSTKDVESVEYIADDTFNKESINITESSMFRDGYFIKPIRRLGSTGGRLRGRYTTSKLNLPIDDFKVTSVIHKYRISQRAL